MALGTMTRKWLIAILLVIGVVLLAVWLYTGWASEQVESEVGDDPVSMLRASARPALPPPLPTHSGA